MKRPLAGVLATAFFGAVAVTAVAPAPAFAAEAPKAEAAGSAADTAARTAANAAAKAAAPDFAGTVALSNCSGSLVKMPESKASDPGLVLTNGHCREAGMPEPGQVIVDEDVKRNFTLLDAKGGDAGSLTSTKIAYGTMTDTDVALYELDATYEEIKNDTGIDPLEVQAEHPEEGTAMTVVSGYWKETFSCSIDAFVPELREDGWTMKDSIRYTKECETKGGTSGSPVIDDSSGKIVGINNTRNEDGEECTLNNPCEVDKDGKVTVHEGIAYGQQTHTLTSCIAAGNKVDLSLPDCKLPKP
ncbi:serine protease [Streptomyces sp. WMMB 322]|uniref:S1 family peptidase n=1 Tax=Streptomyces sp. WMMB 322 TaxID=1286821 RepID=UPI0006E37823|nr:serine protease [Streptomyces sp. WMMB 322]SCK26511.1 V8-like Glu-specific endopeptidase [Streptomyces sp. WMMB 322]